MNTLAASLAHVRTSQTAGFAGIAVFIVAWCAIYDRLLPFARWLVARTWFRDRVNAVAKTQSGVPPSSALILAFGCVALAANVVCLRLLWRFRSHDVNIASTFECLRNDVLSNVGVFVVAGAVALLHSPWPDILTDSAMAALFLRSSLRVMANAAPSAWLGLGGHISATSPYRTNARSFTASVPRPSGSP